MLNSVKKFHTERTMFYVWDEKVNIAPKNDPRSHKEWIDDATIYQSCIRGYYCDKLVVYTGGDDFLQVNLNDLINKYLKLILNALGKYNQYSTEVHNGVWKGDIGTIWRPIQVIIFTRSVEYINGDTDMCINTDTDICVSENTNKHSKAKIKSIW